VLTNSDLAAGEIEKYCILDDAATTLLRAALRKLQLSARTYHRVLKVSQITADLAASDIILTEHVAQAVQYRSRVVLS
jgi:magnesium chelatase family protein